LFEPKAALQYQPGSLACGSLEREEDAVQIQPQSLRVLIIDDSLTIRAMIEQILLQHPGCQVVGVASDVETARALITAKHPNLITLDLLMPGVDGMQFLDEIVDRPHCPVVVVSSATKEGAQTEAEAMRRGADACYDKAKIVSEGAVFLRLLKRIAKRGHETGGRSAPVTGSVVSDAPAIQRLQENANVGA
jgi:chemotaxis response regulator CheB